MNNYKRTIVNLFFAVAILGQSLLAQDIAKELQPVRNAYLSNPVLSFDVSAYSYKTNTDKTPELISSGHVKKFKNKYYSSFLNLIFLMNDDKAIMIDEMAKTIDYYEYKKQKQTAPKNFQINIDSLVYGSDSIVMRPTKNGLKQFTIFDKGEDIIQTEIYVDEKTNFIRRILYYYNPSNEDFEVEYDRVDVYYKNIQTSGITETFFSIDKYIKKNNAKYEGIGEYKNFKVNYYNSKT